MQLIEERLLDAAGRPRSPATMPGYHAGRPPLTRRSATRRIPRELRRSSRSCARPDRQSSRGAILVRHGKGDKRREVGMDEWGWEQLRPWLDHRSQMPVGVLLCVINGPTSGRPWSGPAARTQLRRLALNAGVRRRFAPHQLRHAHAVEMAREGVPLNVIQRQLGHADLGVTSIYFQGIDNTEVISAVHSRRPPTMPASAGLLL